MKMRARTCTITKRFEFEAAHRLPNHQGKCANLHGHSYKLEVSFYGPIQEPQGQSSEGMVVDFADVGAIVKERIIKLLDHRDLNAIFADLYDGAPTTAENIAWWIFEQLADLEMLDSVRLWETATSFVTVTVEGYHGEMEIESEIVDNLYRHGQPFVVADESAPVTEEQLKYLEEKANE
jgi:6-pyruvoyltetrahydropterin/6-carboxytetrahydropterin synthase